MLCILLNRAQSLSLSYVCVCSETWQVCCGCLWSLSLHTSACWGWASCWCGWRSCAPIKRCTRWKSTPLRRSALCYQVRLLPWYTLYFHCRLCFFSRLVWPVLSVYFYLVTPSLQVFLGWWHIWCTPQCSRWRLLWGLRTGGLSPGTTAGHLRK